MCMYVCIHIRVHIYIYTYIYIYIYIIRTLSSIRIRLGGKRAVHAGLRRGGRSNSNGELTVTIQTENGPNGELTEFKRRIDRIHLGFPLRGFWKQWSSRDLKNVSAGRENPGSVIHEPAATLLERSRLALSRFA